MQQTCNGSYRTDKNRQNMPQNFIYFMQLFYCWHSFNSKYTDASTVPCTRTHKHYKNRLMQSSMQSGLSYIFFLNVYAAQSKAKHSHILRINKPKKCVHFSEYIHGCHNAKTSKHEWPLATYTCAYCTIYMHCAWIFNRNISNLGASNKWMKYEQWRKKKNGMKCV